MSQSCKFCGHNHGATHAAREMMFGWRDHFRYWECQSCGSLQLIDIPADLSRFYAGDYYSFRPAQSKGGPGDWLRRQWYRAQVGDRTLVGSLARLLRAPREELIALGQARVHRTDRILEVGSGMTGVIAALASIGFTDLTGADPFLPEDAEAAGYRLLRKTIDQLQPAYRVVLFNHSLEHMPEPLAALSHARRLLTADGVIVVRVPVVNETWRQHGPNWVELDAPRHLAIPSLSGLQQAAQKAGLRITATVFDSTPFELIGTRLYAQDIPLHDARATAALAGSAPRQLRKAVAALNREQKSGRACFTLVSA